MSTVCDLKMTVSHIQVHLIEMELTWSQISWRKTSWLILVQQLCILGEGMCLEHAAALVKKDVREFRVAFSIYHV